MQDMIDNYIEKQYQDLNDWVNNRSLLMKSMIYRSYVANWHQHSLLHPLAKCINVSWDMAAGPYYHQIRSELKRDTSDIAKQATPINETMNNIRNYSAP